MIAFLIISTLSLGMLLAVYHLVLQRERIHGFKRFYLLLALFFSLSLPFIEIRTTSENLPVPGLELISESIGGISNLENEQVLENPNLNEPGQAMSSPNQYEARNIPGIGSGNTLNHRRTLIPYSNALSYSLWSIYLSIAFLLLFRLIRNLWHLHSIIKTNPTKQVGKATLVLLNNPIIPHSFLNHIFLSKVDYESKKIETEVFQHELTHVRQKHSLDILLIEFLSIIFWFNPLFLLYKKAIKLNHEFLADDAVLQKQNDVTYYQQILLSKIFMNKASGLASHIHYSLTKKRLIMMTKKTSLFRALALKAAMAPLFIAVLLSLCTKILAQNPPPPPSKKDKGKQEDTVPKTARQTPPKIVFKQPKVKNLDSLRAIKEHYYSRKGEIVYTVKNGDVTFKKRWSEMTQAEKDLLFPPPQPPKRMYVTQDQLDEWSNDGKFLLRINGYRKENEALKNFKPGDFGHYTVGRLYPLTQENKGKFHVNVITLEEFKKWRKKVLEDLGLNEEQ
jgi:hypothetical protein